MKTYNFQVGIHPYVIALFGVDDPANHRGIVVGALADALFRFSGYRK